MASKDSMVTLILPSLAVQPPPALLLERLLPLVQQELSVFVPALLLESLMVTMTEMMMIALAFSVEPLALVS